MTTKPKPSTNKTTLFDRKTLKLLKGPAADNPRLAARANNRWSDYDISEGIVAAMFELQRGRCKCCGKSLGKYNTTNFVIDHDHHLRDFRHEWALSVRGLICAGLMKCNMLLENRICIAVLQWHEQQRAAHPLRDFPCEVPDDITGRTYQELDKYLARQIGSIEPGRRMQLADYLDRFYDKKNTPPVVEAFEVWCKEHGIDTDCFTSWRSAGVIEHLDEAVAAIETGSPDASRTA